MKLATWLSENKKTDTDFANEVGVNKSTVGRWLSGEIKPRLDQFPKIMEVTGGTVTANDFVDIPEASKVEGSLASPSEVAA